MDARLPALRALLAGRTPVDAREEAALATFDDALSRLARPFDQEAGLTHLTASSIVVGPRGVLLLLHKRLGIWVQPGGHLEPGEQLADAALREACEETGLAMCHPEDGRRFVHVDVHDGGRGHTHLDVRWLLLADGDPAPPAGESQQVRWFSWDEAIAIADPGLTGALRALRPT